MLTCCATRLLLPHGTEIIVKAWHPVVNIYLYNLDMSYGNYSPSLNSCCSFSLPRFTVQPSNLSIVYHKSHSKSTFKVYFQVDFEENSKQSAERRCKIPHLVRNLPVLPGRFSSAQRPLWSSGGKPHTENRVTIMQKNASWPNRKTTPGREPKNAVIVQ